MQKTNETAYRHEYMGEVVGSGTSVFENLRLEPITDSQIAVRDYHYFGQDWGWYSDPNHFTGCAYDSGAQTRYIYEEYRGWRQSNAAWSEKIRHHMDDINMDDPGAGGEKKNSPAQTIKKFEQSCYNKIRGDKRRRSTGNIVVRLIKKALNILRLYTPEDSQEEGYVKMRLSDRQ